MLTLLTLPPPSWPLSKRTRYDYILYSLALEECAASRTGTASGFDNWICAFRDTEAGQMSVVVYSYDIRRSRRFSCVIYMILYHASIYECSLLSICLPQEGGYLPRLFRKPRSCHPCTPKTYASASHDPPPDASMLLQCTAPPIVQSGTRMRQHLAQCPHPLQVLDDQHVGVHVPVHAVLHAGFLIAVQGSLRDAASDALIEACGVERMDG